MSNYENMFGNLKHVRVTIKKKKKQRKEIRVGGKYLLTTQYLLFRKKREMHVQKCWDYPQLHILP